MLLLEKIHFRGAKNEKQHFFTEIIFSALYTIINIQLRFESYVGTPSRVSTVCTSDIFPQKLYPLKTVKQILLKQNNKVVKS